jgi:CBS domain-containing protein
MQILALKSLATFKLYFILDGGEEELMSAISVRNVFTKSFSTVKENDPVSRCLEIFKKEMPPVIAVVNERGKYSGVISRRWIIRARPDPENTKVKTLMRPAPKVPPEFSLSKAAKLMIESGIRQLPVFEKNKLAGFVTDEDIIHGTVTQEWGNTTIDKIMTRAPQVIEADRSVGAVLTLFREHGVSHVPVIDKGKVAGIISIHDIIEQIFQPRQRQTLGEIVGEKVPVLSIPAKGIMTHPVITVNPETTLEDAAKKMHKQNISCLVVLSQGKLAGIVTKLDFLEPISQMEIEKQKLTIQFGVKGIAINPDQQTFMIDEFKSFAHKYKDALDVGTLFIYMKTHGTNHKGVPLIHCRLQLRAANGFWITSAEGWGIEPTFRVALDRMDKRLLRSKELSYNPKYARDFMRKIGMPQE